MLSISKAYRAVATIVLSTCSALSVSSNDALLDGSGNVSPKFQASLLYLFPALLSAQHKRVRDCLTGSELE